MQTLAFTPPGGGELIVILIIVILLFGAKKLPELGSSVGKSIKNFKRGLDEGQADEAKTGEGEEQITSASRDPK
jgi:sec-independent protein translocase protein TatA